MTNCLNIDVLQDTKAFEALEEDWDGLYLNCERATPFQSWAWLYSWWESYGEAYSLRLITLRSKDGLLVGLMPLMLERRWGFVRLLFVGAGPTGRRGITPYQDIIVRVEWEDRVFAAASSALKRLKGWHMADLQYLRPEAAVWDIFRRWDAPKVRVWQSNENYLLLKVEPWEKLLMSLDRKLRSNVRRTIRRAKEDGVTRRLVSSEEAEKAAHRMVTLHRELWRGRGIIPQHSSEKYESLIVSAARRMTARGLGSIYEFRNGGVVILAGFMVFGREFDGTYIEGTTKEALRRYQWTALVRWYTMEIAYSRNSPYLSLMEDETPYKLQWGPEKVLNSRMILSREWSLWFFYAGYRILLGVIPWMRLIRRRYRTLRTTVCGG